MGLVPITHDIDESVAEIEWLAGKPGIKGIMIPTMWHGFQPYGSDHYDRVWAACAETGLVVHTHSGEADFPAYGENVAMYVSEVPFWTHRALWQLLFSGKFDKFDGLRYAVVECGSYWIADLAVEDRCELRRQQQDQEAGLAHEGPDIAPAVGILRRERVHRGVHHEHRGDPPPPRQRDRRADVGHRLPPS